MKNTRWAAVSILIIVTVAFDHREKFYSIDRHAYPDRRFLGTETSAIFGARGTYAVEEPDDFFFGRAANNFVEVEQLQKFIQTYDYVQVLDAKGRIVPTADNGIAFAMQGAGRIPVSIMDDPIVTRAISSTAVELSMGWLLLFSSRLGSQAGQHCLLCLRHSRRRKLK